MKRSTLAAALLIAGASFVGCDTREEPITTPPPAVPATRPAASTGAMDTLKGAATDVQTRGAAATDAAAVKATEARDATAAAATDAKNTAVATAQKYYDQAKEMIAKRDFSGAQDLVTKLESLQSQLPAEWQAKITELKSSLTKLRSAMPTTMPN
jgi:uncharacterized lipoprotein NlpE involved in copper resistance